MLLELPQQPASSQQQPMVVEAPPPLWQRQLQHYEAWACSLGQKALVQAVPLASVLSALRIVVRGFPEATTAQELETLFNDLMAAHGAVVAPGCAVTSCSLQPQGGSGIGPVATAATAVLQLRCAIEASNCLAFDGMLLKDSVLKVARPQDYIPEAAVLLGPTEPNPAVRAAVASTAAAPSPAACGDACTQAGAAAAGGSSCSFAAAVRSSERAAAGAATGVRGGSCAAGAAGGKAGGGRGDLLLPGAATDQSKQDEVFIGGLPSHWKAQQLKELLAPFGPLKSLSVAMDAATGKNKGYAFVVFACSDMVSHAIEQLDCRVVEGKILAVQRATEGKASFGRESSTGGNDIGVLRDGGMGAGPPLGGSGGSGGNLQHLHGGHAGLRDQQQHAHQQQPQHAPLPHGPPLLPHRGMHHRSSSTGSGLGLPPHMLPSSDHSLTAASALSGSSAGGSGLFGSGGSASSGGGSASGGHTRSHSGGGHGLPGMAAFAAAGGGGGSAGPLPPPAATAAGDGSTLGGPRVPTGPPPPGASVLLHSSGPSSTKQYDVNELYIGDLPLTWDEDAVRRLLGRFGRIKYFTLRNGRDKNFAFCKFKDSSVVDAAISGLHGKIVDGYFLNVRRAVEGKQQAAAAAAAAAQQQQWLGGKQHPPQQQQQQHFQQHLQQQHGGARASFDASSSVAGGRPGPGGAGLHPHAHHVRSISSDQHAHFSKSVPSAAGLLYGMPGGGGRAGASPRVPGAPGVGAGAAAAAAPAGENEQQQAHAEATSANSAPSTPGTPTAALEQPEPQFGDGAAGPPVLPPHPGPFGPPSGPPLRPAHAAAAGAAYLHQQQQLLLAQQQLQLQQQAASYGAAASLFNGPLPPPMPPAGTPASLFGPQCPASWPGTAALQAPAAGGGLAGGGFGGGALGGAAGGGKQEVQAMGGSGASSQAQRQSLLQTWDMLSPWSLFSSNPSQ